MRLPRLSVLVSMLVAGGVLFSTAVAGAGTFGPSSTARAASNTTTYQDSTGENPLAPDITTIVVSNNDAGTITFKINIPNRATFDRDMLFDMLIDTDNNPATGDPESFGTDYAIEVLLGEAFLFRWDGQNFTRRPGDPASTSLIFGYSGGVQLSITAAELGNTKAFGFDTFVLSGLVIDETTGDIDFTNAHGDAAPAVDSGLYKYEVKTAPPTLEVQKLTTVPKKPVAGKLFSAKLTVTRSDTGAVLKGGQVTCVGRAGRVALRAKTHRFVGSQAVCTWLIPAGAKGKTFRGSVAVVFEGLRAAKAVSGKIG